jgi:hypothetical protein
MTTENELFEQHIRDYQLRMQRIDELMARAKKKVGEETEHEVSRAELEEAGRGREKLATLYEELKLQSTENWRKEEIIKSGPMGVWDALAQQLERLIERLER